MYKLIRLLPLLMLLLASCHEEPASRVPFGVNDNLIVTSDSLVLQYQRPTHNLSATASADSVVLFRKDALVIAQVTLIPEDEADSILMQKAVSVEEGDTPQTLQRRVMEEAEWILLPAAAEKVCRTILENRKDAI